MERPGVHDVVGAQSPPSWSYGHADRRRLLAAASTHRSGALGRSTASTTLAPIHAVEIHVDLTGLGEDAMLGREASEETARRGDDALVDVVPGGGRRRRRGELGRSRPSVPSAELGDDLCTLGLLENLEDGVSASDRCAWPCASLILGR